MEEVLEGAVEGVEDAEKAVLSVEKVNSAIKNLVKVLADLECTVAEAIQAVKSVEYALRSQHPGVFELMEAALAQDAPETAEK